MAIAELKCGSDAAKMKMVCWIREKLVWEAAERPEATSTEVSFSFPAKPGKFLEKKEIKIRIMCRCPRKEYQTRLDRAEVMGPASVG